MADNTIIQQGSFTADGANKVLKIRSDVDWMRIVNYTQAVATNNGYGFEYYWQRGMGTNSMMKYHPAGDHTMAINASANTFQLIDSSSYAGGARTAVTAGTNATQPVYGTASTAGLATGAIVRIDSTDHDNLNGKPFSIDTVVTNTSFRLANAIATAPGVVAGANGYYKLLAPNVEIYNLFYPTNREIANITQAANAVVTTLVDHAYTVGQVIRFKVPSEYGMTEMDGLTGTITAVTTSTFTVNIDSSGFTAFQFPLPAIAPFVSAQVVPFGEAATSTYANTLDDATRNQGHIGMILTAGTTAPAGSNNDVIYWVAGKSFSNLAE